MKGSRQLLLWSACSDGFAGVLGGGGARQAQRQTAVTRVCAHPSPSSRTQTCKLRLCRTGDWRDRAGTKRPPAGGLR